jgi:chitinase
MNVNERHISRLAAGIAALGLILALLLIVSPTAAQRDTTPPTAPVLSVTEVSSTYVRLQWTASTDDGPYICYQVFTNGSPSTWANYDTSVVVQGLTPSTTYVFTVKARDNGINWSPPSNAVTVTTTATNSGDTTPPTVPTNLSGWDGGCGEEHLKWSQSTDNVDPQFNIRYEIYVNGIVRPESFVIGRGSTVAYAVSEDANTFEVFAVDSAGNRSAPASLSVQSMSPPCG